MATQIPSGGITADNMEAMFKQAQARNMTDDLQMTPEETEKFSKAFQDPEFRKMMAEYVDEISDPKNRQEYNDYIRQCEAGGDTAHKIPEGMQLILPKVGFCLKATSKKNGKVFVNITHTEKLREFSVARVPCQGENWSMPY